MRRPRYEAIVPSLEGPDCSDHTCRCCSLSSHVAAVYIDFYPAQLQLVEFVFMRMMTVNSEIVMLRGCNLQVMVCGFMYLAHRKVSQML